LFVEVLTGLLFVAATALQLSDINTGLLWLLLSVLVVIFVYDIRHYIIPDMLTIVSTLLVVALTAPRGLDAGAWTNYSYDALAAFLGAGFLFMLWFVSKGRWLGFGDVKLAIPLGLLVGVELVFSFVVVSFWVGAFISILLLGFSKLQRGQLALRFLPAGLTIKSVVPFAPFLILGCLIVFFTSLDVLTLFTL
jgi:leader peptidase (prepilin peptidase)/N-methyltransferase